jgi:hypothetical protein
MRGLWECRLADIGRFDRECGCGRTVLLPLEAFAGCPGHTRIVNLKRQLRCDNCGRKGHVDISDIL